MNEEMRIKNQEIKGRDENKHTMDRKSWIIAGSVIILIGLFCGVFMYNIPEKRIKYQLELGNKYLAEQKYEEAIIEFAKVIEIDEKYIQAYVASVEAYLQTKNEEEMKSFYVNALAVVAELDEIYIQENIDYVKELFLYVPQVFDDNDKKIEILEQGLGITNQDEEIIMALEKCLNKYIEILMSEGRYEEVRKLAEKYQNIAKNVDFDNTIKEIEQNEKKGVFLQQVSLSQNTEQVVEELEMIDVTFELSDFSIFGYDLFEDYFEDICLLLGVPSNSEFDRCDVTYGAFNGEVFVRCEENEKEISFNDIYGPSSCNQAVYEVYKDSHIHLANFIYAADYKEVGKYESAEFLDGPVLVGDSYQKWLDAVKWTEIEKVENREESEMETIYYFQTKWGRAKYSAGKDKEMLGDQLEIFFTDDDNESRFSIWICCDSDNMIKQVYMTYYM